MRMVSKKDLVSRFVHPGLHIIKGWYPRVAYNKYVKEREVAKLDENLKIQKDLLFRMLTFAVKEVPYYREVAMRDKIAIRRSSVLEDLAKFPLLTKEIIREQFTSLQCTKFSRFWRENTSGGSTGEPVKIVHDDNYIFSDWTEYSDSLGGYEIGDKVVRLWGSERDIFEGSASLRARLINRFYKRTIFLNAFRMTDDTMRRYIDQINSFRPKAVIAYVQSAYEIAKFSARTNYKITPVQNIITSAGTLFPSHRSAIESAFGGRVFNRYGSREVGNVAMECSAHEGLHLNLFSHYVELVDESRKPVPAGTSGELVVTLLTNKVMPLIRYCIGDVAVAKRHLCSCGRGWPMLEHVVGRTVNLFKCADGSVVDGEYFTHLFYFIPFVKRFQVVQEDMKRIMVFIETVGGDRIESHVETLKEIEAKIHLVMGNDCDVLFKQEEEILPTASGKFVYTVSKI